MVKNINTTCIYSNIHRTYVGTRHYTTIYIYVTLYYIRLTRCTCFYRNSGGVLKISSIYKNMFSNPEILNNLYRYQKMV